MTELRLRDGQTPIPDPGALLEWYLSKVEYGPTYYTTRSSTPAHLVTVDDLGFAVLFLGRPSADAAKSLAKEPVDITGVPSAPLADLDTGGIRKVVETIVELIDRPGFGCALTTKVLHKKRRTTIPVMDNKAIFATYLKPEWQPGRDPWPQRSITVRSRHCVEHAIEQIAADVNAPGNEAAWTALESSAEGNGFTRIELFDMVWWAYARSGSG